MRWMRAVAVIVLCFFSTAFAYDWSTNPGSGSAENPYQISTAEQLMSIGSDSVLLTKNYILTNDIDLTEQTFISAVIAPDLDSNTRDFQGTDFTGIFDGNRHVITNLRINGSEQAYDGLFGWIGVSGQVINLGLTAVNIVGSDYVGGLCGYNNGTISQSYATGVTTGVSWGSRVGGLCGHNSNAINQSYATVTVTGEAFVGGLCGYNNGTISQSYAAGAVTGVSWGSSAGGLCGQNDGTVKQGYATGLVTVDDVSTCIGGFCAYNLGTVTDSYWDLDSSGQAGGGGGWGLTGVQMKQAASFAGWNDGAWTIDEGVSTPHLFWENTTGNIITTNYIDRIYAGSGTIEDPYRIVDANDLLCLGRRTPDWNGHYVLVNDIDLAEVNFTQAVIAGGGGVFTGVFNGNNHAIKNLSIFAPEQSYIGLFGQIGPDGQAGNLRLRGVNSIGRDFVGGLCGGNEGVINQSSVIGSVTGSAVCVGGLCGVNTGTINQSCVTGAVAGGWWVGGLCGSNENTITQSYSLAAVSGNIYVGGLVGGNYGVMISQSYTAGMTIPAPDIGGLCGDGIPSKVSNSFWDKEISGQYYSEGGTGKTTAEMKTLSMFTSAGWDFVSVWSICEGTNYPRLQWQIPMWDYACPDGVGLEDLEYFVGRWLMDDCTSGNNYCGGADIDASGKVDLGDYSIFVQHWLEM